MKDILMRIDDLGYSEGVNYGIARAVKAGPVNHVGLMTNMPWAAHGYDLIKDSGVSLGLHANISAGCPLSPLEEVGSLIVDGRFKSSSTYNQARYQDIAVQDVITEIRQQVEVFKMLVGKLPDYIDVHAVFHDTFNQGVAMVAKEYGLPFVDVVAGKIHGTDKTIHYLGGTSQEADLLLPTLQKQAEETEHLPLFAYHPGFIDQDLIATSSLTLQRVADVAFLTGQELRDYLEQAELHLFDIRDLEKL